MLPPAFRLSLNSGLLKVALFKSGKLNVFAVGAANGLLNNAAAVVRPSNHLPGVFYAPSPN
jgi:hypothetical protein